MFTSAYFDVEEVGKCFKIPTCERILEFYSRKNVLGESSKGFLSSLLWGFC